LQTGSWNGFLDQKNIIECANVNAQSANFLLTIKNAAGRVTGSTQFSLAGFQTKHFPIHNFANNTENAYGSFELARISGTSDIICHNAIYKFLDKSLDATHTKDVAYAFTLPTNNSVTGKTAGTINSINPNGGTARTLNWLTIQNPHSSAFSASIYVYTATGELLPDSTIRIANLASGKRLDSFLSTGAQQGVGLYRIVPDNLTQPYSAFVTRYGSPKNGAFTFAFPLYAMEGTCQKTTLPISTMDPAYNWFEIANPTSAPITVEVNIRDSSGTLKHTSPITHTIAPFAQHHIFVNQYLGARNVGNISIECENNSGKILAQSMFYGKSPTLETEWAYTTQATTEPFPEGAIVANLYNTYLNAANWNKFFAVNPLAINSSAYNTAGTLAINRDMNVATNGSLDLGIHELSGKDTYGLLLSSVDASMPGSEHLRVFPTRDNRIGYIMRANTVLVATESPDDDDNGPGDSGGDDSSSSSSSSGGDQYSGCDGEDADAITAWATPQSATVSGNTNIGLAAYHQNGISHVDFFVDGNFHTTVTEEAPNPATGEYEYFITVNTANLTDDETHTVTAIVYPTCGSSKSMLPLNIQVDNTPTYLTYFADATNGDDSNDGSSAKPFKTLEHAIKSVSSGDTIKLRNGSYTLVGGNTFTKYTTITADDGHDPRITDTSVLRIHYAKFKDITFDFSNNDKLKMLYSWSSDYIWVDSCLFIGKSNYSQQSYGIHFYSKANNVVVENSRFIDTGKTVILPPGGVVIARGNDIGPIYHDAFNFGSRTLLTGNYIHDIGVLKVFVSSDTTEPFNVSSAKALTLYHRDHVTTEYDTYEIPDIGARAANPSAATAAELALAINDAVQPVTNRFGPKASAKDGKLLITIQRSNVKQSLYVGGIANSVLQIKENNLETQATGAGPHNDVFQYWGGLKEDIIIRNNRAIRNEAQGFLPQAPTTNLAFVNNILHRRFGGWDILFEGFSYQNILIEHNTLWSLTSTLLLSSTPDDDRDFVIRNNIIGSSTTSGDRTGHPAYNGDYNLYDLNSSTSIDLNAHSRETNKDNSFPTMTPLFHSLTTETNADGGISYLSDFNLHTNSPARDNGKVLADIPYDIDWNLRDEYPDAGASEYICVGDSCNQCVDLDEDGYAGHGACEVTDTSYDCSEGNSFINPSATELCDGIDNNCNGVIDEGHLVHDNDSDGLNFCSDNCPNTYNPNQVDRDNDGLGDACDALLNFSDTFEMREKGIDDLDRNTTGYSLTWKNIQGKSGVVRSTTVGKWMQTDFEAHVDTLTVTHEKYSKFELTYDIRKSWTSDAGFVFLFEDINNFYYLTQSGSGSTLVNCGSNCIANTIYRVRDGIATPLSGSITEGSGSLLIKHGRADMADRYTISTNMESDGLHIKVTKTGQFDPYTGDMSNSETVEYEFVDSETTILPRGSVGLFAMYQPHNHVAIDNVAIAEVP
jgi:hypothetical protein